MRFLPNFQRSAGPPHRTNGGPSLRLSHPTYSSIRQSESTLSNEHGSGYYGQPPPFTLNISRLLHECNAGCLLRLDQHEWLCEGYSSWLLHSAKQRARTSDWRTEEWPAHESLEFNSLPCQRPQADHTHAGVSAVTEFIKDRHIHSRKLALDPSQFFYFSCLEQLTTEFPSFKVNVSCNTQWPLILWHPKRANTSDGSDVAVFRPRCGHPGERSFVKGCAKSSPGVGNDLAGSTLNLDPFFVASEVEYSVP